MSEPPQKQSWLNRTVLGVGLTSLLSDWSHETATAVLPAFLAAIGAGPMWLGAIEGIADGLSSFLKLAAGHYTDRLKHRKPLAVFGYASLRWRRRRWPSPPTPIMSCSAASPPGWVAVCARLPRRPCSPPMSRRAPTAAPSV